MRALVTVNIGSAVLCQKWPLHPFLLLPLNINQAVFWGVQGSFLLRSGSGPLFGSGISCLQFHPVVFCSFFSWPQAGHQQEGSCVLEAELVLPMAFTPQRGWSEGPFRTQPPEKFRAGLLKKVWVFNTALLFSVSEALYAGMNSFSHGDLKLFWRTGSVTLLGIFIRISPCQTTFLEFPFQ